MANPHNEKTFLVITAVGPDRPGIVSELSATIHGVGANLEDSRMAALGGEFAVLLLASGTEDALGRLEQRLAESEAALGLRLLVKRTTAPRPDRRVLPYSIRVSGFDRPGIVQAVTGTLARRGVNVRALESRLAYAPHSGTPLFVLNAELDVPSELTLSELRRELSAKCEEENLDLSFESIG
ncbi:MAG TPA: ACT domain-containing protein [Polyangiaceae bacterium]|nr:ACT domain-containing protein [Polyangiaceae bacterium]